MRSNYVIRTASDVHDEYGMFAISVFLALDMTIEELCAQEPYLARYGQVRLSTAGTTPGSRVRTPSDTCASPLRRSASRYRGFDA